MVSGRRPILLDVPMDVLADSAEVLLPDPVQREARGRIRPAADDIERAAALLRDAKRPVIVAAAVPSRPRRRRRSPPLPNAWVHRS
jgi:thiamine pyrophosphate-dependent acetolactate synthase large subunit-like protein